MACTAATIPSPISAGTSVNITVGFKSTIGGRDDFLTNTSGTVTDLINGVSYPVLFNAGTHNWTITVPAD